MMAAAGWLIFEAEIEIQEFFGVYFESFGQFEDGEERQVEFASFHFGNTAMIEVAAGGQVTEA